MVDKTIIIMTVIMMVLIFTYIHTLESKRERGREWHTALAFSLLYTGALSFSHALLPLFLSHSISPSHARARPPPWSTRVCTVMIWTKKVESHASLAGHQRVKISVLDLTARVRSLAHSPSTSSSSSRYRYPHAQYIYMQIHKAHIARAPPRRARPTEQQLQKC